MARDPHADHAIRHARHLVPILAALLAGSAAACRPPAPAASGMDLAECGTGVVGVREGLLHDRGEGRIRRALTDRGWVDWRTLELVAAEASPVRTDGFRAAHQRFAQAVARDPGPATVTADVFVDARGVVTGVELADPDLAPGLAAAALEVFRSMRYQPAVRDGCRLPVLLEIGLRARTVPIP